MWYGDVRLLCLVRFVLILVVMYLFVTIIGFVCMLVVVVVLVWRL